jgi:cell wall-associated NlpC family hydrolase
MTPLRRRPSRVFRILAPALAAVLALSMTAAAVGDPLPPASPAPASPLDLAAQIAKTNSDLWNIQSQVASAQAEIQSLDTTLEVAIEAYDKANEAYTLAASQLATTTEQLDSAQTDYQQTQAVLADRVKAVYMRGDVPMLLVALGAADFKDMVTRARMMVDIAGRDAQVARDADQAQQQLAQLQVQQAALVEQQALLVAARGEARHEVEAKLAERNAYVARLQGEFARLTTQAASLSAAYAAQLQQGQQLLLGNGPGLSVSATWTPPPGGRPEAVKIAMQYLGVPYVWGGESPSGFDCSGLMQYTFAQLGIRIPRVSRDQYQVGMPVERAWLLPGDLVFFSYDGTPSGVHHVAMYIGDGKMIEAPHTGANVRIVPLRTDGYIGARRI